MQLGQNVYAYGKSFRKSCPSSLGTSQARTLLDETSWGTQYCPTAWIQQALDRMWGRTGGQGNKALGPAGEIKKRRHQCLPCNPGFCLIFQGSSWNSAMTSFSFFFPYYFLQQEVDKAIACLSYVLNWLCYRTAELNHVPISFHWLGPPYFIPCWSELRRSTECTGPECRTTLDFDNDWDSPQLAFWGTWY